MYVTLRDRTGKDGSPSSPVASRVATTVILLGIVSLLTDISSEMVNAVLPLYLTTQVGLGLFAYGFVDGLYQGVSAVVRIAGGFAADRGQRPKWVAVVGYGVRAEPHRDAPRHSAWPPSPASSPPIGSARVCAPRPGTR